MIEGRWRGTSANAKGTTYEFQKLRHAVLHRASGSSPIFYSVYRDAQPPWPLDLGGFPPGHPRQGKILYCIFAVDQDRMRLACEPGGSKDTAEQKRPKAFGAAQTQEFVREAGPSE